MSRLGKFEDCIPQKVEGCGLLMLWSLCFACNDKVLGSFQVVLACHIHRSHGCLIGFH